MRSLILGLVVLVAGSGCTASAPGVSPSAVGSVPSASATGSATAVPSPSPSIESAKSVTLHTPAPLGERWQKRFEVRYGPDRAQLSTSPGGDDGSINWGPSKGAQLPDGSWWIADLGRTRLAHYSADGAYLGEVVIPPKFLVDGLYAPWQSPVALSDGTVALSAGFTGEPRLLLLKGGRTLRMVNLSKLVFGQISDGTRLYGFNTDGGIGRIDPGTGVVASVKRFRGQGGLDFSIQLRPNRATIELGGVKRVLPVTWAEDPKLVMHPSVEAAQAADGTLWVAMTAFVADDPANRIATGLFSVSPDGTVSPTQTMPALESESDDGTGWHLAIRPGGSQPTLMTVDTDAVRISTYS